MTPEVAVQASIGGFSQKFNYEVLTDKFRVYSKMPTPINLIMPLSVIMQYHFVALGTPKPYIGLGYSYQFGFDIKSLNLSKTELKGGGGVLLQAGIDVPVSDNKEILLNLDAQYTHKIKHDLRLDIDKISFIYPYIERISFIDHLKISTLAVTVGLKMML